jgi:hypothetical protein
MKLKIDWDTEVKDEETPDYCGLCAEMAMCSFYRFKGFPQSQLCLCAECRDKLKPKTGGSDS